MQAMCEYPGLHSEVLPLVILVLGVVSHLLRSMGLRNGSSQLLTGFPAAHEDMTPQPCAAVASLPNDVVWNLLGRNDQKAKVSQVVQKMYLRKVEYKLTFYKRKTGH